MPRSASSRSLQHRQMLQRRRPPGTSSHSTRSSSIRRPTAASSSRLWRASSESRRRSSSSVRRVWRWEAICRTSRGERLVGRPRCSSAFRHRPRAAARSSVASLERLFGLRPRDRRADAPSPPGRRVPRADRPRPGPPRAAARGPWRRRRCPAVPSSRRHWVASSSRLLRDHLALAAGRLQPRRGIAIERPGRHRGHARPGQCRAPPSHRPARRSPPGAGASPRAASPCRSRTARRAHQPAGSGSAAPPCSRPSPAPAARACRSSLGELVAGARSACEAPPTVLARLCRSPLDADAAEAPADSVDRCRGSSPSARLAAREFLEGGGQLPAGAAAGSGPAAERAEREREALRQEHLRQAVDVDSAGSVTGTSRDSPAMPTCSPNRRAASLAWLSARATSAASRSSRGSSSARAVDRRPLRPDDRLAGQFAELAGQTCRESSCGRVASRSPLRSLRAAPARRRGRRCTSGTLSRAASRPAVSCQAR